MGGREAGRVIWRGAALALDEGPPFTLKTEEVEEHSIHCNKKKKDAKTADVSNTDN